MQKDFLAKDIDYDLLVNWNNRLPMETDFILDMLKKYNISQGSILDVGCGTGRHLASLSSSKFTLTGLDRDEFRLSQSHKLAENTRLIQADFMKAFKGREKEKFDVIYSLGNSFALMSKSYSYEKIFKKCISLLNKSGLLIFQVLNFEKERNGFSKPRTVETEDTRYIFLRKFTTSQKYIHSEIIALSQAKNETDWKISTRGPGNMPRISRAALEKSLKKCGFKKIKIFGDYLQNKFDKEKSVDMIWVAQKSV
ncbi:class I SAM-dependent methyltransferase [Candidatus Margulisiibacteriota bacterium]